jgi:hypothetical protein
MFDKLNYTLSQANRCCLRAMANVRAVAPFHLITEFTEAAEDAESIFAPFIRRAKNSGAANASAPRPNAITLTVQRPPKIAVPTRTNVAPHSMAIS